MSLLIIKLGGSVITYKDSITPKPRKKVIKQLTCEIAKLYHHKKHDIILVHGAGSYGHPIVKRYNLHKGMKGSQQILACSQTLQSVSVLNTLVIDALLSKGLPVVSLPPHSFVTQSASNFTGFDVKIIKEYLANKQLPVLFGDIVTDNQWGCSILSGDTVITYLAQKLSAEKVIFLSDVDGLFAQDPKTHPQAELIPTINDENIHNVLSSLKVRESKRLDVTGEMYGKVMSIRKNLRGIEVIIANGLKKYSLSKALVKNGRQTRLYFASSVKF